MQPELAKLAKRIPFSFDSHLNCDTVHLILHQNLRLNINAETSTKFKNGHQGKAIRHFYINEKGTKMFRKLEDLLAANPDLAAKAIDAYPEFIK